MHMCLLSHLFCGSALYHFIRWNRRWWREGLEIGSLEGLENHRPVHIFFMSNIAFWPSKSIIAGFKDVDVIAIMARDKHRSVLFPHNRMAIAVHQLQPVFNQLSFDDLSCRNGCIAYPRSSYIALISMPASLCVTHANLCQIFNLKTVPLSALRVHHLEQSKFSVPLRRKGVCIEKDSPILTKSGLKKSPLGANILERHLMHC